MKLLRLTTLVASFCTLCIWISCCATYESCTSGSDIDVPPQIARANVNGDFWDCVLGGWSPLLDPAGVIDDTDYHLPLSGIESNERELFISFLTQSMPQTGDYKMSAKEFDTDTINSTEELKLALIESTDQFRGLFIVDDFAGNIDNYIAYEGCVTLDSVFVDPYTTDEIHVYGSFELELIDHNGEVVQIENGILENFQIFRFDL